MTVFNYRELEFKKRLHQLPKAGGKGSQIAERVDQIIQHAAGKHPIRREKFGRITKYVEARIDKYKKLDMEGGYKAICSREAERELIEKADGSAPAENDHKEVSLENIHDRILRRIFCGLSGEQI
jgi:hypothetical protein